jgi:tRNA nucleotidyltransferase (CCA-adding enzyme)
MENMNLTFFYFALWLLPLPGKVQEEVMDRLRVRKSTHEDLIALSELLHELALRLTDTRPSQVVGVLRPFKERVLLAALMIVGSETVAGQQILQYLEKWQHVQTVIDGNDLLAMGVPKGPEIGRLLAQLLTARLDGEIVTEIEERSLVQKLFQINPGT